MAEFNISNPFDIFNQGPEEEPIATYNSSSPDRAIIEGTSKIDPIAIYIQDNMNRTLTNIKPNKSDEYIYGEYEAGEPLEDRHEPKTFKDLKEIGFFNEDVKIIHSLADGNCFLHSIKLLSPNVNSVPIIGINSEVDKKSCNPQYIEYIKDQIKNLTIEQEYTDEDLERFFNKSGEYFDVMPISLYLKLHFGISGLNIKFLIIINSSEGEAQNISIIKSNKGSDSNELKNEIIQPDKANPDKTYDYINYGILILHRKPGKQPHYNAIPYKINDKFIDIINNKINENEFTNPGGFSEDLVALQLDIPINDLLSVSTSSTSSPQQSQQLPPPPPRPKSPSSSPRSSPTPPSRPQSPISTPPSSPRSSPPSSPPPQEVEQELSITKIIDDLKSIDDRFDKINTEYQNTLGDERQPIGNTSLDGEIAFNINDLKEKIGKIINLVSRSNQ
jgi:hypothetical protein